MPKPPRSIPDPCRSCANLIFLPLSRSTIGVCRHRYDLGFNPTTCRRYTPVPQQTKGGTRCKPS
jgi:hypothetical protein